VEDTADAEDQEVVTVETVEVVAEDTVEDHRQVVLEADTEDDRALESHQVVDTAEGLLQEVEDTVEDHRQVVLVVDTRVDRTEALDIVVLRVEAMEVMHSATMVDLVHLAVSTQIVHVHHAENNRLQKNQQSNILGISSIFFMVRRILIIRIKTLFAETKKSPYWEKIKKLPIVLRYTLALVFVLF
jgi:hypothetical protein